MKFGITLKLSLETKIKQLVKLSRAGMAAQEFWTDLAGLLRDVALHALDLGEEVYDYKHAKLQSRLLVRGPLAIQFAVNEEHLSVFVERLTVSDVNPYPTEIEEILNHEPF